MTTKLAVIGASGRTGGLILSVLGEFPNFTLSGAVVSETSKKLGHETVPGGIRYSSEIEPAAKDAEILIDFSTPLSSALALKAAVKFKRPILIATTGLAPATRLEIESSAAEIPILVASNTSIGIHALGELTKAAQRILGPSFDVEILEIHHRHKKDAPSGTALTLARGLKEESGFELVSGRAVASKLRADAEIGVESLRGGDVAGDHTVYFFGRGERIELTHRVSDRAVFARGALRLAQALMGRKPGLYSVADLLRV